ncbi:MAG: hypothetical protein K2J54_03930, partial [Clostridia bacterium]|nr:hypothetical protein [Clostridia bacterium]
MNLKKRTLLATLSVFCIGSAVIGVTACTNRNQNEHNRHDWGGWYFADESDKPATAKTGKLTRACQTDGCSATESYVIPVLNSEDYKIGNDDTATCKEAGEVTYTYTKYSFDFKVATPVNADAHDYGAYVNTDKDGHYRVCAHDGAHTTQKQQHDAKGPDGACSVCGYNSTNIPPAVKHNWGLWTVAESDKPTKVKPGKATRTCTDADCNEVDTEIIELPPLASVSEYTLTDNTADCTKAGTATYTFKENPSISFTAVAEAKGHDFGKTVIVNCVPFATCTNCGDEVAAELNGTINPS